MRELNQLDEETRGVRDLWQVIGARDELIPSRIERTRVLGEPLEYCLNANDLRVWRASGLAGGSPTKSVREDKTTLSSENERMSHPTAKGVYGCFGRISRATFCTPGYSSPVHTTSKLSSRRRRITCHGPG